ncbi:MAG: hypothetical protein ABGY21_08955 [Pseudomonadota bacterium]
MVDPINTFDAIRRTGRAGSLAAQQNRALDEGGLLINDGYAPEPEQRDTPPHVIQRQQEYLASRGLADGQQGGQPAAPAGDPSLLDSIISGTLSGIGMAGNLVDLPASMVRDVLGAKNPFDQLATPFSFDNRLSGRDLGARWGLLSKNKETGWVPLEDPVEFAQDALGFALELATDPLALASGWLKAGRAAEAIKRGTMIRRGTGVRGQIRRGAERFGDTVDKYDPGHRLGMAAYQSEAVRGAIQGTMGKVGEQLGKVSSPLRAARKWADTVDPFPKGGERDRFAKEARGVFGGGADQVVRVQEQFARRAGKANNRPADDYFKGLSARATDEGVAGEDWLRQGEAARFDKESGTWSDGSWERVTDSPNDAYLETSRSQRPSKQDLEDNFDESKKLKIHGNRTLKKNDKRLLPGGIAKLRIDIPFFNQTLEKGKPQYAVTIHGKGNNVIGYDDIARLEGDVTFNPGSNAARRVFEEGKAKDRFATVRGKFVSDRSIPDDISEWTAVGYNPHKSVYFYDKKTGKEILSGTDAISVGNTVYVREVTKHGPRTMIEGSPQFRKFFGDSKVVDEGGQPLRVFHGSPRGFEEFQPGKDGAIFFATKQDQVDANLLAEFTDDPGVPGGKRFPSGANVKPAYLRMENPLEHTFTNGFIDTVEESRVIEHAKANGYDGVKFRTGDGTQGGLDYLAVFEPNQIKSTFNRAPTDDTNILFHPAYHGSPHTFDKFTLDHIGTGEGAQVYGWGLYFADRKSVGIHYKNMREGGPPKYMYKGAQVKPAVAHRKKPGGLSPSSTAENMVHSVLHEMDYNEVPFQTAKSKRIRQLREALKYAQEHRDRTARAINDKDGRGLVREQPTRNVDKDGFMVRKPNPGPAPDVGIEVYDERIANYQNNLDLLDNLKEGDVEIVRPKGKLYEVDLAPKEEDYLLWDRPIMEQSDKVRKALSGSHTYQDKVYTELMANQFNEYSAAYDALEHGDLDTFTDIAGDVDVPEFATEGEMLEFVEHWKEQLSRMMTRARDGVMEKVGIEGFSVSPDGQMILEVSSNVDNMTGKDFYKNNLMGMKQNMSPEEASKHLLGKGIKGIKYYDGSSRRAQQGTHNYVIFDDADIAIKNVLEQAHRGAIEFNGAQRIIHGYKARDISTLLHETAHDFRRQLSKELSTEIMDEAQAAIEELTGAPALDPETGRWTRAAEEAFAEGFERYVSEGVSPVPVLNRVFEKLKELLLDVYKSIAGLEQEVSPDLRKVFDSMLETDELLNPTRIQRVGAKAVRAIPDVGPALGKARLRMTEAFINPARAARADRVQEAGRLVSETEKAIDIQWRSKVVPVLEEIMEANRRAGIDPQKLTDGWGIDIRRALEEKGGKISAARLAMFPKEMHEPLRQLKSYHKDILTQAQGLHINIGELEDISVDYLHRRMRDQVKRWAQEADPDAIGGGRGKSMNVSAKEHQGHREELFRNAETNDINKITSDAELHEMLDKNKSSEDVGRVAKEKYGDLFEENMPRTDRETGKYHFSRMQNVKVGQRVGWREKKSRVVEELLDDADGVPSAKLQDVEELVPLSELDEAEGALEKFSWEQVEDLVEAKDIEPGVGRAASGPDGVERSIEAIEDHDGYDFVKLSDLDEVVPIDDVAVTPREVFQRIGKDGAVEETFERLYEDRFEAFASHMYKHPEYQFVDGIFTNVIQSLQAGFRSATTAMSNATGVIDIMKFGFRQDLVRDGQKASVLSLPGGIRRYGKVGESHRGGRATVGAFFDKQSMKAMNKSGVYDEMLNAVDGKGKQVNGALKQALKDSYPKIDDIFELNDKGKYKHRASINKFIDRLEMDMEVHDDMLRAWDFQTADPFAKGVGGTIANVFRSFTALFKAGVLTAPARYSRDVISGQIQNMTHGIWSFKSAKSGMNVLFNRADDSLMEIPDVASYMQSRGMEMTGQNATKAVREMYTARRGHSSNIYRDVDLMDTSMEAATDFESMTQAFPGGTTGFWNMMKEAGLTAIGRRGEGSWDPREIAGFNGRRQTLFNPVRAGDIIGKHADDMNRLPGFIESMRKGVAPDEAMEIVERVQLNYDPHTFTPTEQQLKRIFPFYSFFSRELAYLGRELMVNPTGRLGKLIRLQAKATPGEDEEQYVPEYVRSQMAIPLGDSKDGGQNYLTNFGLMHEDPIATLGTGLSDPQEGMRNILSKMNPLIKGFAEYGLGRSSFQGGPLGGRDLSDMDPNMGRILTQLGLREETPSGKAEPFISRGAEFAVSNSPISRIISSTKTLLDDRKSMPARALNLTTGMNITTVSPDQSRRALRDIGNAIARDAGARPFETFHISKDLVEYVRSRDPELGQTLEGIKQQRSRWGKERRNEIRRTKFGAATTAASGEATKDLTKAQAERHERWLKKFGSEAQGTDSWGQYVFQSKNDGTPSRSGIKDWGGATAAP